MTYAGQTRQLNAPWLRRIPSQILENAAKSWIELIIPLSVDFQAKMSEVTGTFPVDHQLNDELRFDQVGGELGLRRSNAKYSTLPGQPRVRLDQHELQKYLQSEFLLPQLDRLAPKLWLVCLSAKVLSMHQLIVLAGRNTAKFPSLTSAPSGCPR